MVSIASLLQATPLPALEARLLMMHVLDKTRVQLITQDDLQPSVPQQLAYQSLVQRRLGGEPIAYLVGHREFFGLELAVTPAVLIPRPETELLVELAQQRTPPAGRVLDLGTGSGAIAIALAHQRPDLQVSACDISPAALDVARSNATTHHCAITFWHSDWYAGLPAGRWHTIVSNPPYIEQHDPHLQLGDLRFEPIDALTDHADGLSAYRQIIAGATHCIEPDGWLLMEHGYNQAADLRSLLAQHGFADIASWCDLAGIERVSGGRWRRTNSTVA